MVTVLYETYVRSDRSRGEEKMSRDVEDYLEEHLPYEVSMMQHTLDRLAHTTNKADPQSQDVYHE